MLIPPPQFDRSLTTSVVVYLENLNLLLHSTVNTLATKNRDEVCFVYTLEERIDPPIFKFETSKIDGDSMTYTFKWSKIIMYKLPIYV